MKLSLWLLQLILVQYNDDASDESSYDGYMVEPTLPKKLHFLLPKWIYSKHAV